jgi:hypothetical protein
LSLFISSPALFWILLSVLLIGSNSF